MVTPLVHRVRAAVGSAQPVVYAVGMGGSSARAQPVVYGFRSGASRRAQPVVYSVRNRPAGMVIEIGPPGSANAFDTCQVSGVSRTPGVTPDQWIWRVVSVVPALPAGRSIALVGSGNRIEYIAPATREGCVITFEAIGRSAGIPDSVATVQQTITAHGWEWTGPTLDVPVRGPLIAGREDYVTVYPSTYSATYTSSY